MIRLLTPTYDFEKEPTTAKSKCQGKWPDQTLDQAFGLPEVLVAVSASRLFLQEGRENANIDAGLGFIWRISVNRESNRSRA